MSGLERAAALLALAPALALGWPVDRTAELKLEETSFLKLGSLEFVEVDTPAVLSTEVLPTGELLLSAGKAGQTLLMTEVESKPTFWRVQVGVASVPPDSKLAEAALAKAQKACPGMKVRSELGQKHLQAAVQSDGCRRALRALLERDDILSANLDLTFDVPTLQAQLRDVGEGFSKVAPQVKARYLGAGLVLSGEVTPAEHRAVLWELFRRCIGRLALDDGLKETP